MTPLRFAREERNAVAAGIRAGLRVMRAQPWIVMAVDHLRHRAYISRVQAGQVPAHRPQMKNGHPSGAWYHPVPCSVDELCPLCPPGESCDVTSGPRGRLP